MCTNVPSHDDRPSAAITNLMWDHIYYDFLPWTRSEHRKKYRAVVDKCRQDYQSATAVLRLPGANQMNHFKQVIDVPLVVRMAKKSSAQVRKELGVAEVSQLPLGNQE